MKWALLMKLLKLRWLIWDGHSSFLFLPDSIIQVEASAAKLLDKIILIGYVISLPS
jgi:hypothetical protein